jgi:hypothetical protein
MADTQRPKPPKNGKPIIGEPGMNLDTKRDNNSNNKKKL